MPASPIQPRKNALRESLLGKQCAVEISLQATWKKNNSLLRSHAIDTYLTADRKTPGEIKQD